MLNCVSTMQNMSTLAGLLMEYIHNLTSVDTVNPYTGKPNVILFSSNVMSLYVFV